MEHVQQNLKQILINKFHCFELKILLRENRLSEAYVVVDYLSEMTKEDSVCGEFFALQFDFIYQTCIQNEHLASNLLYQMLQLLVQASIFDHQKYTRKLLTKFLNINQMKFAKHKQAKQDLEQVEEMKLKVEGLVNLWMNEIPLSYFSSFLLDFCHGII